MTDSAETRDRAPTIPFDVLRRCAQPGKRVSVFTHSSNSPIVRVGLIQEIHQEGILLQTDTALEWVSALDVHSWQLSNTANQPTSQAAESAPPPSPNELGRSEPLSTAPPTQDADATPPVQAADPVPEPAEGYSPSRQPLPAGLPSPTDLELLFAGEPSLALPDPVFSIPSLPKPIQQDVTKWKNRYDYAKKVREPARVAQDVPKIAELADTLQEPSLHVLAGLLADFSGLGIGRAKAYFKNALEFDSTTLPAVLSIAAINIREQLWADAINSLLQAVRLNGDHDKTSLVRCLGQCVLRLDKSQLPPIGTLLAVELSDQARKLAVTLIALAVKNDSVAYTAALSGNADDLRKTKTGNELFPWGEELPQPITTKRVAFPPAASAGRNDDGRRGRVSTYFVNRNFGFIVEDGTGQTWFFHRSAINNDALFKSLIAGRVRQEVTFTGDTNVMSGKYPLAQEVTADTDEPHPSAESARRAPLRLRLQTVPRDGSDFAKAMEAEQLDDLDNAELLYQREINSGGKHGKSAIKNLASLKHRRGDPRTALALLKKHEHMFATEDQSSFEQLRVQFLVKAKMFPEAAELLARVATASTNPNARRDYLRLRAYCLLASGEFDESIECLRLILRSHPNDNGSQLLLAKALDAKKTGLIPLEFVSGDDESRSTDTFSSIAIGLSAIARRQMENCELRGIDARIKERGNFTERDFTEVERLLDRLRGIRPRERADYFLTLARLCEMTPDAAGARSLHSFLRRHFAVLAEASYGDGEPLDVVRCYALESLYLGPARSSSHDETTERALLWLLGTYIYSRPELAVLLRPPQGQRLKIAIELLSKRAADWQAFQRDAAFFQLRAPSAFQHLCDQIKTFSETLLLEVDSEGEHRRQLDLDIAFRSLPLESLAANTLRHSKEVLAQHVAHLLFQLDRDRVLEFVRLVADASDYSLGRHFRESETRFLRLESDFDRISKAIEQHPTHLSVEQVAPALGNLRDLIRKDFRRLEATAPELRLRNVLDSDFYVVKEDSVALRLLLESSNPNAPPVEAISLVSENMDGDPCHSPEPLPGGSTREIELAVRPSATHIAEGAFSVSVKVIFRTRTGEVQTSQAFPLAVRLDTSQFEEIANPYGRYSGGSPVEDEQMFFGRHDLIERVTTSLSTGTMDQCFVLYGQKRSGKSSVLKQLEKRLGTNVLFASVSAGTFSPENLWGSFAKLLIQELTFRLEDMAIELPHDWPARQEIIDAPLESIRLVSRHFTRIKQRLVIAIDEFTYLFESQAEQLQEFMRGWKALLEARTFNAILVGQDTMPRFKQAFPNEFGVTHDERLTYLTVDEAAALATEPIYLPGGKSRFRGGALTRLFSFTAGSPFFLQIFCDHLVRHLNTRRASFVTEADIEQVARTLTVGGAALPPERFDALVTAAGETVATVPKDDLWKVLALIARESLHSDSCNRTALDGIPNSNQAVKDLIDREILAVEGDRVSIRVGLFALWLRNNEPVGL